MSTEQETSVFYAALPAEIRPRAHQKPQPHATVEAYVRSKWRSQPDAGNSQRDRALATKVDGKHLLLHNPPAAADSRTGQRRGRAGGSGPRSGSSRSALKAMQTLPPAAAVWDRFVPLHELWLEYIHDVLSDASGQAELGTRLLKADFHGALLHVTRSLSSSLVGTIGILIKETQHTLTLVTPANRFRVIPKRDTVFVLRVSDTLVTLFGSHMLHRSAERASRKFKSKSTVDVFG